jgi:hypothetical protein
MVSTSQLLLSGIAWNARESDFNYHFHVYHVQMYVSEGCTGALVWMYFRHPLSAHSYDAFKICLCADLLLRCSGQRSMFSFGPSWLVLSVKRVHLNMNCVCSG